ncbi:MAG: CheR family methyltransferase [Pseudomonadota bacterium]
MTFAIATCPFEGNFDFIYNRGDFDAISALIYSESGNVLSERKAMLVYSRLTRRLRVRNLSRFEDYINLIENDAEERRAAVALLTTNHTYFFREEHHFKHFENEVRPHLLRRAFGGEAVRIWSAGCSSGEEVYSLGMTILGENAAEAQKIISSDFRLLASDLADHVLVAAQLAEYPLQSVAPVPERLRRLWVNTEGDTAKMDEKLRNLVRFRRLNLLGTWPLTIQFDVIFCRNVMIYFDESTKAMLLDRFSEHLVPGGLLYIGHSERLFGNTERQFEIVGKSTYRKHMI